MDEVLNKKFITSINHLNNLSSHLVKKKFIFTKNDNGAHLDQF